MGIQTRREWLWTAASTLGVVAGRQGSRVFADANERPATSPASIGPAVTISTQSEYYHGWPTLARRSNGELLVVCSGGRESHVCPFGRVELIRSHDNGQTWTWPRVLTDGPIDDRDAGILETAQGTLLVTTFTSLAYEPSLRAGEAAPDKWDSTRLARWQAADRRISADERQQQLGVWMLRSTDDGISWTSPYRCLVNSPHGPTQLADGRLLYAGKQLWEAGKRIGVCESTDDGVTWQWLADIPTRAGDQQQDYHELHAVETSPGRVVLQIRNHNSRNKGETLQTESTDGGQTWSEPHAIGVWGLPSHLLRLVDGRLLMSYGHRRVPFGCQARLSSDEGRSWSDPIVVYGNGAGGDLGYPSTVQLDDGSLVTAWYELPKGASKAGLRMVSWRI